MATKKMQDGGPADAMQKAMGQKPVSTKKTMRYVRKKGSGYIPPSESNKLDTSKWAEKQASPNAKKMQKGGMTSQQLKKSGQAQKRMGAAAKLEGQSMKSIGQAMKVAGMRKKAEGTYEKNNGKYTSPTGRTKYAKGGTKTSKK
jgi:hypothetical protein